MPDESPSHDDLKRLIKSGRKIEAIKMVREESGIGLKEAKDHVDQIESQMIATGEMVSRTKGCLGAVFLLMASAGTFGTWFLG